MHLYITLNAVLKRPNYLLLILQINPPMACGSSSRMTETLAHDALGCAWKDARRLAELNDVGLRDAMRSALSCLGAGGAVSGTAARRRRGEVRRVSQQREVGDGGEQLLRGGEREAASVDK